MRNSKSVLALGAAALCGTAPASAESPDDTGWFIEATVVEAKSSDGKAPLAYSGEDRGFGVGGGYKFTKHFGVQATYYDVGKHGATDCTAPVCTAIPHELTPEVRALSVAALGTWRFAPALEIFGKLGLLSSRAELEGNVGDEADRTPLIGVGLGIRATSRVRVNLQYERADHDIEIETAGVGLSYRF